MTITTKTPQPTAMLPAEGVDHRLGRVGSVVVKLTNRCNIRCAYCYENIVAGGDHMSLATYASLVRSVFASTNERRVVFIWHGGEPTLLPIEWFERAIALTNEMAEEFGKRAVISIQTNLIKVSDEKLRLFAESGIRLGVSLDDPTSLPLSQRPLASVVLKNYHRAKSLGVGIGILSTINTSNSGAMKDFCRWLHNDLGVDHFKANVAYSVGTGIDLTPITETEIWQAQRAILDYMLTTDGAFIEDNLGYELINFFETHLAKLPRSGSLCGDQTCGAGRSVIGVTPSGDLLPCGRFQWNDSEYFLGGIADPLPIDMRSYQTELAKFQAREPGNWSDCGSCDARSICGFGCQAFIVRSKRKLNNECQPTKQRLAWYLENIELLRPVYLRFCAKLERPALTPFKEHLERLRSSLPPAEFDALRAKLGQEIASKRKVLEHAT
jgi:uncharacterized protein